jgi:hypothetical protein
LALLRPILSIMADGEAAKLISENSLSKNIDPSNTDAIAAWLIAAIQSKTTQTLLTPLANCQPNLDWCSRTTQARQLANLLEESILSSPESARGRIAPEAPAS